MNQLVFGATSWFNSQLDRISRIKDRLVIFAALVYAIGYAVWSINALINNLGLLPAIQLQYFIAGIVPVTVFFIARGVWVVANWFLSDKWPSVVGPEVKGWRMVLRNLIFWVFAISFLLAAGIGIVSTFVEIHESVLIIIVYTFAS